MGGPVKSRKSTAFSRMAGEEHHRLILLKNFSAGDLKTPTGPLPKRTRARLWIIPSSALLAEKVSFNEFI